MYVLVGLSMHVENEIIFVSISFADWLSYLLMRFEK